MSERDAPALPDLALAPLPMALVKLHLVNMRSYADAELNIARVPIVLAGANGSGKTNVLEAISLLSPGRGLRGAKYSAIQRKAPAVADACEPFAGSLWAVSATLVRDEESYEIGTGLAASEGGERRLMRLNGAPAAVGDLAELLPMLWLTPVMDRLFTDGASGRRKFLDRLVFGLDSAHARRVVRYETAMRERARLLKHGPRDPAWLDGLEETMAETGIAITAARLDTIAKLNGELEARRASGHFPCAHMALTDDFGIENLADPAIFQGALRAARIRDAEAGRTSVGPHLSDLAMRHTAKRIDAKDCSTGEQKALLISVVLANAWLQSHMRGIAPVLLFDEIAAHLDVTRRAALFEEILALKAQAWMTGTDAGLFEALKGRAEAFSVSAGQFAPLAL